MRSILFFIITFLLCCQPVFGELTARDIEQIRAIVREDVRAIVKEEITSVEKQITGVEKQVTMVANFIYALIVLIVLAVGIPQIIMVWRDRRDSTLEAQIAALTQEVEKLKQQIVNPS